jgi:hypothetical protein
MLQRLANVIYWAASGAAVLCFLFGVLVDVDQLTDQYQYSPSDWILPIAICSGIAGLIWLAGKAARYVLAG